MTDSSSPAHDADVDVAMRVRMGRNLGRAAHHQTGAAESRTHEPHGQHHDAESAKCDHVLTPHWVHDGDVALRADHRQDAHRRRVT